MPMQAMLVVSGRSSFTTARTSRGTTSTPPANTTARKSRSRPAVIPSSPAERLPALKVDSVNPAVLAGCLVAGSFGATMSVLMRMSAGKFDVNHEIGREYVTNLGIARPYIGAIFALLLYFAVKGGLTPQIRTPTDDASAFAFFVSFGFLIGFSERFAKEIVRSAEAGTGASPLGAEVGAQGVDRRAQSVQVGA